jgi:hypothetical protein
MVIIERDGANIPDAMPYEAIHVPDGGVSQRVVISMRGARKRWEERTVNRMVTLPAWLDERGREANLNFSQLLQAAVARELQL